MKGPLGGREGFTLLELLVAITLLAAIMAILTGGFSLSLRSWEASKAKMEGHYDITEGMYLLSGQVKMAKRAFRVDEKNKQTLVFSGNAGSVEFVSAMPRLLPSDKADGFYLQKITFDGNKHRVVFGESWFQPYLPPEKVRWKETSMGQGKIKSFRLEYLVRDNDPGKPESYGWADSVNSDTIVTGGKVPEMPKAVRMRMETGGEKENFVWPPMVAQIYEGSEIKMPDVKR